MKLPQDPVFVVGYPRSGTTLVQRLLAAQPGFVTLPETHYFSVVEKRVLGAGKDSESVRPDALAGALEAIREKTELRFGEAETALLAKSAASGGLTSKALFEAVVILLLRGVYPDIDSKAAFRWIEKTPNHAHFLDRIAALYPRMRAIHVVRHPVAAAGSRRRKFPFNAGLAAEELARRWARLVTDVERFRSRNPGLVLDVRYEDFFPDPMKPLEAIGAFLGVPPEGSAIRAFLEAGGRTAEAFILDSEPWKLDDCRKGFADTGADSAAEFSEAERDAIESIAGEGMKRYGYGPRGKS